MVVLGEVRPKSPTVPDLEQVAARGTAEAAEFDIAAFLGSSSRSAGSWGKQLVSHMVVGLVDSHNPEPDGLARVVVGNTLFGYLSSTVVAPASGRLLARPTVLNSKPSRQRMSTVG